MAKVSVARGARRSGAKGLGPYDTEGHDKRFSRCKNDPVLGGRWLWWGALVSGLVFWGGEARGDSRGELRVQPASNLAGLLGRPLAAVQIETEGALWAERLSSSQAKLGEPVTAELARRVMDELLGTGRFASARAELLEIEGQVTLVVWVRPRRVVARLFIYGSRLDDSDTRRELGLVEGADVTELDLERARTTLERAHGKVGFTTAQVTVNAEDTDDPMGVLLRVQVTPGPPERISAVLIEVAPSPHHTALVPLLDNFGLERGDVRDADELALRRTALEKDLSQAGFYEARVDATYDERSVLQLKIWSGPRFQLRFHGQQSFDRIALSAALNLAEKRQPVPELLEAQLRDYYVRHGFLDAQVRIKRRDSKDGLTSDLDVLILERPRVSVVERVYPCLGKLKRARELDEEIDGILYEQFPVPPVLDAPDGPLTDEMLTNSKTSTVPSPLTNSPYATYSKEAYQRAAEHLEELLQSEGYLHAEVGPVSFVRRRCSKSSPPGACQPEGERSLPVPSCEIGRPYQRVDSDTCESTAEGARCEAEGIVVLPVRPGPLARLYDIALDGNEFFSRAELMKKLGVELGQVVERARIEAGLRRIRDLYAEEGFAFAEVESALELSPDKTRARMVLSISERKQVTISRVVVRGATRTRESLIRKRIALESGKLFRRSLVTRTQRQVESLGVFNSVSVALEDPGVPAREKVLLVTVAERMPQYLDIKGGFSTGDGFRIGFEYGHRNIGGEAIQLTLRSQLGLRPPFLIVEDDVRARYSRLNLSQLLERRNTLTLSFPETGLGPLFRFELEGQDILDNQRDYSQRRDAGEARLLFDPSRTWRFILSGSVELNNVALLALVDDINRDELEQILGRNPNARVPQGESVAFAQELEATWDLRDRPLAATRGTVLGASIEHVTAVPTDSAISCNDPQAGVFDPTCSEFLRLSARAGVYVPLSKRGLVFAAAVRGGVIQHLTNDSRTYPDRLFFMGGVNTLRGFPQDSLVPEDVAALLLDPSSDLTINQVVLRGGDVFINPRFELRIPLMGNVETALFLDTGNVWADRDNFDLLALRYSVGTGIRYQTPIGPLVFDYGFNIDRVLDALLPDRPNQRTWESLGAFHFSIGYF